MGVRIARVAHELKSPVSMISGSLETLGQFTDALVRYVSVLEQHVGRDEGTARLSAELRIPYVLENARSLVEICAGSAQRLDYVVHQLTSYAHRGPPAARERADVRTLLNEAVADARQGRQVSADVRIEVTDPPPIIGGAAALRQALANVIANAFDAVAVVPAPRVVIAAEVVADAAGTRRALCVRVRDNGPGVPCGSRDRIFAAFYTTKSRGSGLGLGLPIAAEIVGGQGGSIELAESDGAGATFVIRVPVGGA